jgi:NAD(P)-dependent dehydrogenase (short-subunit alcohol dehydrogenase family)
MLDVNVLRLSCRSATRVICGDIDEQGAQKVANHNQIGDRPIYLDVAEPTSAGATVQEILDSEGRVDIMINNAGADFIRSTTGMTLAEWDRVQHVNLRAP